MDFKKYFIFICLIMITSSLYADYIIREWGESAFGQFNVTVYAKTTKPENELYWDGDLFYFKGNTIYLYTYAENDDNLPNLGGDLSVDTVNGGNKTALHGIPFETKFRLRHNSWGWHTEGEKKYTFKSDSVIPTIRVDTSALRALDNGSPKIHFNGTTLFFNPYYSGDLQLISLEPTDDGSGCSSDKVSITGISKNSSSFQTLSVTDYVGHVGTTDTYEFSRDASIPTFNATDIVYQKDNLDTISQYTMSTTFSYYDNTGGSGIDINSIIKEIEGIDDADDEVHEISVTGDTLTISNLERDFKYRLTSRVSDNVENQSIPDIKTILLSAPAIFDSGIELGADESISKTRFYYDEDNNLWFKGVIDLGKEALDPTNGIDNIELSFNVDDDTKIETVFVLNSLAKDISDDETREGLELHFNLIAIYNDNGISKPVAEPHKSITISLTTNHKNANTQPEVRTFPTEPVPNRSISGQILNISNGINGLESYSRTLTENNLYYLEDNIAIDSINTLLSEGYTFTTEMPNRQLEISDIVLVDLDSDLIDIFLVNNGGFQYIVVEESYDNYDVNKILIDSPASNRYLIKDYKYKLDEDIITDGLSIIIADKTEEKVVYNNTNHLAPSNEVNIRINNIPVDQSGIKNITFFNVPTSMKDIPSEYYNSSENLGFLTIVGETLNNSYHEYSLEYVDASMEKFDYVSVRIEDNAGNIEFLDSKKVLVDKKDPSGLSIPSGIIKVSTNDIKYEYSDMDSESDVITLTLDDIGAPSLNELDDKLYTYLRVVNNIDPISFDNKPKYITDVNNDKGVISITIDTSHTSYVENEKIDIHLLFTDYAGNSTENGLSFYTPGIVYDSNISRNRYHNRDFDDWIDDIGNHIDFTVNNSFKYGDVNIYKLDSPNYSLGAKISGSDSNLTSHGEYKYIFKSVNGSGFENNKLGTHFTTELISVGNNSPKLKFDVTNDITKLVGGKKTLFLGPKSSIIYSVFDHDGATDSHRTYFYINGDNRFDYAEDIKSSISLLNIYSESDENELINKKPYSFKLGIKDSWGTAPNIEYGKEVSLDKSFIYDNEAPVLISSEFDKDDGFSYLYGDVYINIYDEGAGVESVFANVDDRDGQKLTVTKLTGNTKYTHKITLIEGEYNLFVNAKDRLGNETSIALIDTPIKVDHNSPSITGVVWGDNSNLILSDNLLSSVNSNFIVKWSDTISLPSVVNYSIINNNEVVFSSHIDVRSKSESLLDNNLSVSIINGEDIILENSDYTVVFNIKDSAGNISKDYILPFSFSYDLKSPSVSINNWGIYSDGGINYINSSQFSSQGILQILSPEITITDSVDQNVAPIFKISGVEYTNIDDISLSEEGSYDMQVIGRDRSGHETTIILPFEYDITPPTKLGLNYTVDKKDTYKGGETVQVDFIGKGVNNYYYQIVSSSDQSVLTYNYPGAVDGWITVSRATEIGYGLVLPRKNGIDSHSVIIKLKAVDIANNITEINIPSNGNFFIDNTGEYINVSVKPWVGNDGVISARWGYFPGKNNDDSIVGGYKYKLHRISNGVDNIINEATIESNFVEIIMNSEFEEDDTYYIEVYAILSTSRETSVFRSILGKTDFENPTIESIETPKYTTSQNIYVIWESLDNSVIANISANLSYFHYDDDNEIVITNINSINLGQLKAGRAKLSDLFDYHGIVTGDKVNISISAEDLAGNITQQASNIIIIDNTAPLDFQVIDQGDYLNPDLNSFYFDWIWSEDDPESPLSIVEYQLTENGVIDYDSWLLLDDFTSKDLILGSDNIFTNGSTVVLAVKKTNEAGLYTIGFSNGIVLDNTAGEIQSAKFTFRDYDKDSDELFYTNIRDLSLWVDGYDEQSGITKIVAELGFFENGNWTTYSASEISGIATGGKLDILLPESIIDNDKFRYKIIWFNGTDTASQPFYSRALVYNPAVPKIVSVEGFYYDNTISVNWVSDLQIPFVEGFLILKSIDGEIVREIELTENTGLYGFTTDLVGDEIADGEYYFTLILTDKANVSPVSNSNTFVKDTQSPVIETFDSDIFVSTKLNFSIRANEHISNYSFKIGTLENNSAFSKNWIQGINIGSIVNIEDFDLTQYENLQSIDQSVLQLSIKVSDKFGNWSDIETGLIFVDLTAPTPPVINKGRNITFFDNNFTLEDSFVFSSTTIDDVQWASSDNLSGIAGYKWALVKDTESNIIESQWSEVISVDNSESYNVSFSGLALSNEDNVYIAIKSINGSGLYSTYSFSEKIIIDLYGPEVLLETSGEAGITLINGEEISTYNDKGEIFLNITSEISGLLYYNLKIFDHSNLKVTEDHNYINLHNIIDENILEFSPEPEVYGVYTIVLEIYDPGMNKTTITKEIRYNEPPYSYLPEELINYPMKPYALHGFEWYYDSDNIESVSYRILNNETVIWSGMETSSFQPSTSIQHIDIRNNESEYQLEVRAYDVLGAVKKELIPFKIINTQVGRLYTNEVWSGEHTIIGAVSVPTGVTLTIKNGTEILIDTGAVNGYEQSLLVDVGATLTHEGNASYLNDDRYGNWKGLIIKGNANLNNLTITGAERAITLDSTAAFSIVNSTFSDNVIGLHLLNAASLSIETSNFKNNMFYGIKEELNMNPTVTNSTFSNNGYDYYDFEKTVIDYLELNELDTNNGNIGE